MKRLFVVLFAVLLLSCGQIPIPDPVPTPQPGEPYDCLADNTLSGIVKVAEPIEGEYIVRFRDGGTTVKADIVGIARLLGVTDEEIQTFNIILGFAARMSPEVAEVLSKDPRVQYVQENGKKHATKWNLAAIESHERIIDGSYTTTGGEGTVACIVGTGVNNIPSEFGDRLDPNCLYTMTGKCEDEHGHETEVAYIAAGKSGVAPKAKIVFSVSLDKNGSGSDATVAAGVDACVTYRKQTGLPMSLNASLGGGFSAVLNEAFCRAEEAGIFVAVAAGNDYGSDACSYSPASVKQSMTVGAMNKDYARAEFSNTGKCVDIWAPGQDVPGYHWNTWDGTSASTPHVCGAGLLVMSKYPGLTPEQVREKIIQTATSGLLSGVSGSPNLLLYVKDFGESIAKRIGLATYWNEPGTKFDDGTPHPSDEELGLTYAWGEPGSFCSADDLDDTSKWREKYVNFVRDFRDKKRRLILSVNQSNHPKSVIEPALKGIANQNAWDLLEVIDVYGETDKSIQLLTVQEVSGRIEYAKERALAIGGSVPLIGLTLTHDAVINKGYIHMTNVDAIILEAYFWPEQSGNHVPFIISRLDASAAVIPEDKVLYIVVQGYTRGRCLPSDVFETWQPVTEWAKEHWPRVKALNYFCMHRPREPQFPNVPNCLADLGQVYPNMWTKFKDLSGSLTW